MEVKVKKEVLFSLLKKVLNENRTSDNPGSNFIHPFDRKESTPIEASPHMATQLSEEEPPVGDENYIPSSNGELKTAAARIAQEVPPEQIEYYYRGLHKLLDAAIDKSQEGMLAESNWQLGWEGSDWEDSEYADNDEYGSEVLGGGSIEDVMADPAFLELKASYAKDKFYDGTEEIQFLADTHGVNYTDIEDLLTSSQFDTDKASSSIATTPTPARNISTSKSSDRVVAQDDQDLPEISDEEYDRYLDADDEDIERDIPVQNKQHKALTSAYWDNALNDLESKQRYPLDVVSQVVMDSMDAVSRVIATEVSVKYGFGGGDPSADFAGSPEERAWEGILSNGINTNHEVVYKLPKDKKTPAFWKKRVSAFMNKLQSGSAGSLSEFSSKFTEIASLAFKLYEEDSGLDIMKFMSQIISRVVESILYDSDYGALTRNVASSDEAFLSSTIDTGFSAQIKKEPFNIPTKATFKARKLDPDEQIEHNGKPKKLRDAIVDAVFAYVVVKSDEFKKERRELDPAQSSEDRDQKIQDIIKGISDNPTFTYTSGTGKAKSSFVISRADIVADVNAYVDQKFAESRVEEEEFLSDEEISELEGLLEDPAVPQSEKQERFTDEVASQIMRNTGSVATYKDYVYRVLNKKFDMARKGLEDIDDFEKMGQANYISIFNDTLAEIIPATEEALLAIAKDGARQGLSQDDLNPFIEAITQIRAVKEFVYSPETRGGENTIEKLSGNVFNIEGEEYDALEFFSDGRNVGPAILRTVVSDLIGSRMKGAGLQNIETINFEFEEKVKRKAVDIEKALQSAMLDMFSGIKLEDAQEASYLTAESLGIAKSKAKFLENNMRDLQIKTIYPFVGRVKRLPDFDKMNPAAKNYVCWFTAIADKNYGGVSTQSEREATAKELYNKLMDLAKGEVDSAASEVKKETDGIEKVVNKTLSEVEALEDFTQKEVARVRKDSALMEKIVKQAMKMHLQDIEYFEGA